MHLDFCSLIYMKRQLPCGSLIIILNLFQYRHKLNLHFSAKSCLKTQEELEKMTLRQMRIQ